MFERRLKIFLGLVILLTLVLLARAAQLQFLQRDQYKLQSNQHMERTIVTPAPRGTILDFKYKTMALDAPSIDAAVDYRAIVKDPVWMKNLAKKRLADAKDKSVDAARRALMLAEETRQVSADIDAMWVTLAEVLERNSDDIEAARSNIIRQVVFRRMLVENRRYEEAMRKFQDQEEQRTQDHPGWLSRWLGGGSPEPPRPQDFQVVVDEESQPHVIVHSISDEQYVLLSKRQERCPGLVLLKSTHRHYAEPANVLCAQYLGHVQYLGPVKGIVGISGLEKLFDAQLRGADGREFNDGQGHLEQTPAVPGQTVRCSIDLDLQADIVSIFQKVPIVIFSHNPDETPHTTTEILTDLHGAAVVIDIPTGEVRAMVSAPTFDLNQYDEKYAQWAGDYVNNPMFNRATMDQLEPGSTAKVMIGSSAISWGLVGLHEGIQCTGYLVLRDPQTGHMVKYPQGRCWMQKQYAKNVPDPPAVIGHQLGSYPHRGHDGNADGYLTVSDALMRSCNVVFENIGDRMGVPRIHQAMDNFGLGRRTGIGIEESAGHIPNPDKTPAALLRSTAWFAAIGQGQVLATPLQMANVAASLGRDGVWVRPHLLADQPPSRDDRRNLGLSSQSLDAVRLGMIEVTNANGGTGNLITEVAGPNGEMKLVHVDDLLVAGKTGSAQATKLRVPIFDENGKAVFENGVRLCRVIEPDEYPWYRGWGEKKALSHAWYIGYAPADDPKIAFAVLVEYGGSGGMIAGPIARLVLEACQKEGYLPKTPGVTAAWKEPR